MAHDSALSKSGQWLFSVGAFLLPILFLPITQDFYDFHKWALFIFIGTLALLLWSISCIQKKKCTIHLPFAALGVTTLIIASTISLLLASTNKTEALLSLYGPFTWVTIAILVTLGSTLLDKHGKTLLRWAIMLSGGLLAIFAVYQFFGIGKAMFPNVPFLSDTFWSPTGSLVGSISIFLLILPLVLAELIQSIIDKKEVIIATTTIITIVIVVAIVALIPTLLSKLPTSTLPYSYGWAILLEILKVPKNALIGVGSDNYLAAFSAARPVSINLTPIWNVRFTQSSSLLLHIGTTLGLLGVSGIFTLLAALVQSIRTRTQSIQEYGIKAVLGIEFLLILFVPPSFASLALFFMILLTSTEFFKRSFIIHVQELPIVPFIITGVTFVLSLATYIWVGTVYAAELSYYTSLNLLKENKGTDAYYQLHTTIRLKPNITKYHIALSQTSLALANTLAANVAASPSGATKEQKDKDTKLAADLIQQSIEEARIATTKEPISPLPWENLATIYQSLLNISQGADQWTIATLQQAIQLDPINPIARMTLGGIYIGKQEYDLAIEQFSAAASLKPDLANAHYNISFAYRQKKQYLNAAIALVRAARYVNQDTDDAKRIQADFEDIKKLLKPEELNTLSQLLNGGNANNQSITPTPTPFPSTKAVQRVLPQK